MYPLSIPCVHHFKKMFFSKTAISKPIFMWSLHGKGKQKFMIHVNGPGHMTKTSTISNYVKNLQRSSESEV